MLGDAVLLRDGNHNPVVKLIINFAGVGRNIVKDNKSPRVNLGQTINENVHFLLKDLALQIVDDLENNRIFID